MTKVPECKECHRKNTFVESEQNQLCALCEKPKDKKRKDKDEDKD